DPLSHTHNTRFRFFFFQAEDGIRDLTVTGVQTCALPISTRRELKLAGKHGIVDGVDGAQLDPRHVRRGHPVTARRRLDQPTIPRSEERRVGKECRSRWWTDVCEKREL